MVRMWRESLCARLMSLINSRRTLGGSLIALARNTATSRRRSDCGTALDCKLFCVLPHLLPTCHEARHASLSATIKDHFSAVKCKVHRAALDLPSYSSSAHRPRESRSPLHSPFLLPSTSISLFSSTRINNISPRHVLLVWRVMALGTCRPSGRCANQRRVHLPRRESLLLQRSPNSESALPCFPAAPARSVRYNFDC